MGAPYEGMDRGRPSEQPSQTEIMIEPKELLDDLQRLIKKIENDLRERCRESAEADTRVRADYEKATAAQRTAMAYEIWREELITQAAVAWVLACVFIRFLEDNRLVKTPRLAGPRKPENRLELARDQQTLYFRRHPEHSDREYLENVFREASRLPAVGELLDQRHNPLWLLGVSGDGARLLLDFWRQLDPVSGALVYDFTDPELNTRFLGDIYQDLSEAARKRYALLQTPLFVEEFILDRTLTPALEEFGLENLRLIDPACGSGHFLLGAFERLFEEWTKQAQGTNLRKLAQNALDSIYGVDLNPYAAAIARFRLLVAALKACEETDLEYKIGFTINVAAGDSLLHGEAPSGSALQLPLPFDHYYQTEDEATLKYIIRRNHYHAVVGNPPYITVKDAKINVKYRERYGSCHMKYSLAVPFIERFFDLAVNRDYEDRYSRAGYVGMITANSFMKREFGKKLIEKYNPRWDLTHVIDTSGAYIPGHGTPTVIIFGRNQRPLASTIRTVMGIKGEPSTPKDPAVGLVWSAIVKQIDFPGSQSEFVSVNDTARESFHRHPWSIGGGGAAELKEVLDKGADRELEELADEIGITAVTGEDDLFILDDMATAKRQGIEEFRLLLVGDSVRDWTFSPPRPAIWLYNTDFKLKPLSFLPKSGKILWLCKAIISKRKRFGTPMLERGLTWYEWQELYSHKLRTPFSITFAEVATHNHFVLDRGGKVFNRTAPVIKLPAEATEDEHLVLLGLLNSSTACFWMKQIFQNKGSTVDEKGARQRTIPFEDFYQHGGTGLKQFPIPQDRPINIARKLDQLAQRLQSTLPSVLAERSVPETKAWREAEAEATRLRHEMVVWQEELDWQCYRLYGLIDEDLTSAGDEVPPVRLGERAFEIVMGRRMAVGELATTWFERHGSKPITEIPAHWPAGYRRMVERRIAKIKSNHDINLIERPEYKRRWNSEPWAEQAERALRNWLLNRLEDASYWTEITLTSASKLADRLRHDAEFTQVAEMYRRRIDFDFTRLVIELIESESVPFLPVFRYRSSGLEKRKIWERTWDLQREEDWLRPIIEKEIDREIAEKPDEELVRRNREDVIRERLVKAVGEIQPPPKYQSADFQSAVYWRLRGKLDVPNERFIIYPGCEREVDPSPVIAWAGWDHLQQARAIANYYELVRTREGWTPRRLMPLLAGLLELLPWLKQWHSEVDPIHSLEMDKFIEDFINSEARSLGKTIDEIKNWKA
jgi:uncharacterized protein DUF7008/Eco57I restriction-modification methylase